MMNFSKDTNSFCAETEACKIHDNFLLSPPSTRYRQLNSEETCQYKSFYSACSPLQDYSQRFSNTLEVFDRLALDTNRRYDKKQRLSTYIKDQEQKSVKKFTENEKVYERLLKDTQQRREKNEVKEKFREQELENTARTFRSDKTCSKAEAEAIVKRLLCKIYTDSPRKTVEIQYEDNKRKDLSRFLSSDSLKIKGDLKADNMDIVERTEIEQRYGKPGKPPKLENSKKVILRKGSDLVMKSKVNEAVLRTMKSDKGVIGKKEMGGKEKGSKDVEVIVSPRLKAVGFHSSKKGK